MDRLGWRRGANKGGRNRSGTVAVGGDGGVVGGSGVGVGGCDPGSDGSAVGSSVGGANTTGGLGRVGEVMRGAPAELDGTDQRVVHILDNGANAPFKFVGNSVTTSRYSLNPLDVTKFIAIKTFWEQMQKKSNIYFTIVALVQMLSNLSSTGRYATALPLIIVLGFSMFNDVREDVSRRKRDRLTNNLKTSVYRDGTWKHIYWKEVVVGDLVLVTKDNAIPADVVLLWSSEPDGSCFVSTVSIDGENNLKPRQTHPELYAVSTMQPMKHVKPPYAKGKQGNSESSPKSKKSKKKGDAGENLDDSDAVANDATTYYDSDPETGRKIKSIVTTEVTSVSNYEASNSMYISCKIPCARPKAWRAKIVCEKPNEKLYSFDGYLERLGALGKLQTRIPLTAENILLRGTELSNTTAIIGAVVTTGNDSKVIKNSVEVPNKNSGIAQITSRQILYIFAFQLLLSSIAAIGFRVNSAAYQQHWYLGTGEDFDADARGGEIFLTFMILLNTLIPISLQVVTEGVRMIQAWWIRKDLDLYYEHSGPAETHTSKLNEELGQVGYIFSDKTGTLTSNMMEFRRFACPLRESQLHHAARTSNLSRAVSSAFLSNQLLIGPHGSFEAAAGPPPPPLAEEETSSQRSSGFGGGGTSSDGGGGGPGGSGGSNANLDQQGSNHSIVSDLHLLGGGGGGEHGEGGGGNGTDAAGAMDWAESPSPQASGFYPPPQQQQQQQQHSSHHHHGPPPLLLQKGGSRKNSFNNNQQQLLLRSQRINSGSDNGGGQMMMMPVGRYQQHGGSNYGGMFFGGNNNSNNENNFNSNRMNDNAASPRHSGGSHAHNNKHHHHRQQQQHGGEDVLDPTNPSNPNPDGTSSKHNNNNNNNNSEKVTIEIYGGKEFNIINPTELSKANRKKQKQKDDEKRGNGGVKSKKNNKSTAPSAAAGSGGKQQLITDFEDGRISDENWRNQPNVEDIHALFHAMCLCHTVIPEPVLVKTTTITTTVDKDGEDQTTWIDKEGKEHTSPEKETTEETVEDYNYQAASPDEVCLVKALKGFGLTVVQRNDNHIVVRDDHAGGVELVWDVKCTIQFTSQRRRMSVVVEDQETGKLRLYTKGADSVILARLRRDGKHREMDQDCRRVLEDLAAQGLRTLVFAKADLNPDAFKRWKRRYDVACMAVHDRSDKIEILAEEIERDLDFLGMTAVEDCLQVGVPETIDILQAAGVKTWVLTGDKIETAINVGYACSLIHPMMGLFTFKECTADTLRYALEKYLADAQLASLESGQEVGLVIEGHMLDHILPKKDDPQANEAIADLFVSLAYHCKTVICCRVSPIQKAQIVQAVRDRVSDTTMSIGDGANDVAMIQTSHVGVGISGLEGLQAARASDFAIGQFRFLKKLLFVHGRWSHRRIAKLVTYSFYKCMAMNVQQFWYSLSNLFTGTSLFDTASLAMYNIIFTTFPILAVAVFDRDVEPRRTMVKKQFPELYINSKTYYSTYTFWRYNLNGVFHSLVGYLIAMYTTADLVEVGTGVNLGLTGTGITLYTATIIIVTVKVGLYTDSWTWWNLAMCVGSLYLWFLFLVVYGSLFTLSISVTNGLFRDNEFAGWYGSDSRMLNHPVFWLVAMLIPSIALFRDLMWTHHTRNHNPSLTHMIQHFEQSRAGKFDREDIRRTCPWLFPKREAKVFRPNLNTGIGSTRFNTAQNYGVGTNIQNSYSLDGFGGGGGAGGGHHGGGGGHHHHHHHGGGLASFIGDDGTQPGGGDPSYGRGSRGGGDGGGIEMAVTPGDGGGDGGGKNKGGIADDKNNAGAAATGGIATKRQSALERQLMMLTMQGGGDTRDGGDTTEGSGSTMGSNNASASGFYRSNNGSIEPGSPYYNYMNATQQQQQQQHNNIHQLLFSSAGGGVGGQMPINGDGGSSNNPQQDTSSVNGNSQQLPNNNIFLNMYTSNMNNHVQQQQHQHSSTNNHHNRRQSPHRHHDQRGRQQHAQAPPPRRRVRVSRLIDDSESDDGGDDYNDYD